MYVVDLGCGTCEYSDYGVKFKYVGMDVEPQGYDDVATFTADYKILNGKLLCDKIKDEYGFYPNTFVSLFSTECCLHTDDKYKLYDKMFECNNINNGLVSGFYYNGKEYQDQVEEVGGLISFQSIENMKSYRRSNYMELRTYVDVPSGLFGPDVVEVWKFFIRK
jgi:hypothetical protein